MKENVKGNMLRVYVTDSDLNRIRSIADTTESKQTEILTKIVHAGLACIEGNGNRFHLPLVFTLGEAEKIPVHGSRIKPLASRS